MNSASIALQNGLVGLVKTDYFPKLVAHKRLLLFAQKRGFQFQNLVLRASLVIRTEGPTVGSLLAAATSRFIVYRDVVMVVRVLGGLPNFILQKASLQLDVLLHRLAEAICAASVRVNNYSFVVFDT